MIAHFVDNIIDGERFVVYLDSTHHHPTRQFHVDIAVIDHRISHERIDDAFQVSHTTIGRVGNILNHLFREIESVVLYFAVQDVAAELHIGSFQFSYQSTAESGYKALVHTLQINRRSVACQNNPASVAHQMVEDMEESVLCFQCSDPLLNIVHHQHINCLVEVDEVVEGIIAYGIGILHLEEPRTDIEHPALRKVLFHIHPHGIDEMRLSTA